MDVNALQKHFETGLAQTQHDQERVAAEIAFAESLCELHPRQARAWRPLIRRAMDAAAAPAAGGREWVGRVERILRPLAAAAKTYTVHCVGHAHIDMNWMWSWPETVAVTVDTVSTVLRLMEEYPDFLFSQSQASVYAILEQYRPDLLRRVARRVAEGRWEVTASHWVETDKNLVGGEALCRHLLYARRYAHKLFGLRPEDVPIDWSPDSFGHAATVPTYLARGAVKYLYMHRPGTHVAEKPWLFWWEGPDGARVLVRNDSRSKFAYNGAVNPPDLTRDLLLFARETRLRDHMFVYGVGDHGGGPTRRDISQILHLNDWPVFPAVRFSTARAYFDRVAGPAAALPVRRGELNFEFAGCYTTQTLIKKANRYGENRLVDAEAAAAAAWLAAGGAYPSDGLAEGWRDVLFNHFHDILPGSGVMDTRTYSHGLYQKTMAFTAQAETEALRRLAAQVDTTAAGPAAAPAGPTSRMSSSVGAGVGFRSADGGLSQADQSAGEGPRPFVLFNPTAGDRAETVQATVWASGPWGHTLAGRAFGVRRPDGKRIAAQMVEQGNFWGHHYAVLAFPAAVPGLGFAQYAVTDGEAPAEARAGQAEQTGRTHHCAYSLWERSPEGLENAYLRVDLDPVTGGLRGLTDKLGGTNLIAAGDRPAGLEYLVERAHGMSAWLVQHPGAAPETPVLRDLRRVLKGPYRASIEVDLRIYASDFTVAYELRAGDPKLYVRIRGTWFERGTRETGIPVLNFVLPLALAGAAARYEIPFGAIDRELHEGEEVPALNWAQVSGRAGRKQAGCLLFNDSKHGHALDGGTLRLTLIRSSYEPDILPEIGQHEIQLALRPFRGEMPVSQAMREGAEFNRPVRVVGTDVHAGRLPAVGRVLRVEPATVVVGAVKKAEEGDALVVRLFNPAARAVGARVRLGPEAAASVTKAVEADLMERPLRRSRATLAGGTARVTVPARGIATLLLTVKRR